MANPIIFTDSAASKVSELIAEEGNNNLKLRVYVSGGGCSGFQYGFTFDEEVNEDDTRVENGGVTVLIDSMSIQYLAGAEVDYKIYQVRSLLFVTRMQRLLVVVDLLFQLDKGRATEWLPFF
jgi:iron-sulfur cluster insertion protein